MTELKTLKDIIPPHCKCDDLCRSCDDPNEDLKQEAIKWIKSFDESVETAIRFGSESMAKQYLGNIQEFKKFFNITDEDLKR